MGALLQKVRIIADQRCAGRRHERGKLAIIRVSDVVEMIGVRRAGKTLLGGKQIGKAFPGKAGNFAHNIFNFVAALLRPKSSADDQRVQLR